MFRSKQTQAEAVKLRRIQKELQALDDMVSNDIGILRGRIEQASWDYSAARWGRTPGFLTRSLCQTVQKDKFKAAVTCIINFLKFSIKL